LVKRPFGIRAFLFLLKRKYTACRKIIVRTIAINLNNKHTHNYEKSIISVAQDLPTNPEAGKCYVRCTTPDVYVNETITITVKPAYKVLKTVPATFKTVTERVEIKAKN